MAIPLSFNNELENFMEPLSNNTEENFDRFIVEAIETGCIWALEGEEGFALCPSEKNDDIDVMPFWSQPEFAQAACVDEWSVYKPVAIALEEFLDDWIDGMHEDLLLIGINWNPDLEGMEIEPLDLVEEFDSEIK
ncbi:DUF2750 domain-containing protein [Maricurvus nonylphenolicus]